MLALITPNNIGEALRLKGLGGAHGPFAAGVTAEQFREALRLKTMPEFTVGVTAQQLIEALRLKALPGTNGAPGPFAAGVTASQLIDALRL
jgi:hypothetical protein